MIIVICLLTGKKYVRLKQVVEVSIFQINFSKKAYLINLAMSRQKKYMKYVHDFSVDYDAIDKSDIVKFTSI